MTTISNTGNPSKQISLYLPSRGPKTTLTAMETALVYQLSPRKMDSWITDVIWKVNTMCARYCCKKLYIDKNQDCYFIIQNVQIFINDKENLK